MAFDHVISRSAKKKRSQTESTPTRLPANLYRIIYYDCPPLQKKAHLPISQQSIDFAKSEVSRWRLEFFKELKKKRKVALRLGVLSDNAMWNIRPVVRKMLLNGTKTWDQLTDDDFAYDVAQKRVDMKIGLDITTMTLKKQVHQIILVAGDSDFVPAAKLARREGVDFVLDPMWSTISPDLHEHIDGLRSTIPRPNSVGQSNDSTSEAIQLPVTELALSDHKSNGTAE